MGAQRGLHMLLWSRSLHKLVVRRWMVCAHSWGLHMLLGTRSLHKLVLWRWKAWALGAICTCCWDDIVCTSWWCGGGRYVLPAGSAHAAGFT